MQCSNRMSQMRWTMLITFLFVMFLAARAQEPATTITVDASHLKTRINKNIYGQFSEHLGNGIYGGIWVGVNSPIPNTDGMRNDVIEALKRIKVPVLRWPGGCFADEYHWRDGIGPREKRPSMINTNWGGVTEDNSFGTHEFLEFCRLVGCEPYITGNVGSGTVQEMSQWVEYVNSDNVSPMTELRKKNGQEKAWKVKYWGIGNESWGCGGNMRPEFYADQVRRYGTYCRDFGDARLFKIACGPGGSDYAWTDAVMRNAGGAFSGLSLHYYSFSNQTIATDFDEAGWFDIVKKSLLMQELIERNSAIMDKFDPNKKVALVVDEWGTWYKVEPGTNPGFLFQQNTMRDAVAAACNLNIFNNHADRVRMANIAQTINVLQAMILTKGEKMVLTPTYYVFDMFKVHQDAMLVPTRITTPDYVWKQQRVPAVSCSASLDARTKLHISLCNVDPNSPQKVSCTLKGFKPTAVSGTVLTAKEMNVDNTFEKPATVVPGKFTAAKLGDRGLEATLPPKSVVVLELEGTYEPAPLPEVKNARPGISWSYYTGHWGQLPVFDSLKAERTGVSQVIEIPAENSGEDFGVQYSGYLKIPKDGLYTFFVNSDDGADLSLDGDLIVDNDGQHAPQEQSGTAVLKAGYHPLKVRFFQAGGEKVLQVGIQGPGMPRQALTSSFLYH